MSLLEITFLYRRAFVEYFFYHSPLSPAFQALLDIPENQIKLSLWQQTLERATELTARELISDSLHFKDQPLAVIALAQTDAMYLSNKLAQQQEGLMTHVLAIKSVLKLLKDKRQDQKQSAKVPDFHVYTASPEDIQLYLASIANHSVTQNFYQFIKATYRNVVIVTCSADLSELDLSGGQFQNCDFSGAKIRLAKNADFRYCQLVGTDLQQADLMGCDFRGANLSFANAQNAKFKEVNLTDTIFTGANLSHAYLNTARSEKIQWIGANLTEIKTESLLIAEQLQQKQHDQTQQFIHHVKRQQQVWQALLPTASKLLEGLSGNKILEAASAEQQQTLSTITCQLQQTILTFGLLRHQLKALQSANQVLKIASLTESLAAVKQSYKALRDEAEWQNLLSAWQEIQKELTTEQPNEGLKKLTGFMSQSQERLQFTQHRLQAMTTTLTSVEKGLHNEALKQWQTTRVRMAFDQALIHIESEVSRPYRRAHQINNEEKSLSCFISYSWGDPVNERKVHRIAADLRQAGIGMLLDIWDNKPGTSVSRFTHETRNCDVVLLTGTLKLMEKWRIKMGVVSQEIPQIYGRLDQTPVRRVIGLQLNGDTLEDVLPAEYLERKTRLGENDFVDLRQVYESSIFQILRGLYQVQPNTLESQAIDTAERMFLQTAHAIEQAPLTANIQALGYEGEAVSEQLSLSLQAIQRYETEKQAQKRALENLLPTTLNKLYQAYETRQKQEGYRIKENMFGLQSELSSLAQPLAFTVTHALQQTDCSPVLLLKTTPETATSVYLLEKTLWRNYQSDPEHQSIPVIIDFKKVLNDVNGQLPDNYDTVMHVLKQQLHYSEDEIQRLKSDYHLAFIFAHYEALNALSYAPYIDNHLEQWPQAKAIVLCDQSFLENKNYQTVFSAGKQFAHLKLWEGATLVWTAEEENQWQAHLKAQPIVRAARELPSDQTEVLRDFVIQEQLNQALKMVQKRLSDKASSLYLSYAPGEPGSTWQLIERLLIDLPYAGFKVLMDVRNPVPVQEDNINTVISIPSSRYLAEMEQSDFILVTGSRWYLQQYEQKAQAIQEELDKVVQIEESSKTKSQGSKNFTSPVMPLLLERPADPKARLETVLPPMQALRDSVCIDFKRSDQDYFDVLFDQLIPALYQASVYQERQAIIQEAYQQFKQMYLEAQKLDAEGLLQKVGYKQPTLSQAEQYLTRQVNQQELAKMQLTMLVPARLQPLYQAHQQRVQQPELSQALAYYVPLDGQLQPTSEERFELGNHLTSFLDPKNASQVLLLQGESGSGKSLNIHRLEQQLWQAYRENPRSAPIPILIELKAIESDVPTNFVEHYLQQRLGYSPATIKQLKTTQPVIFLFDGYDELPGQPRSVFIDNQFQDWQQAKVIVTVRPSVIKRNADYGSYFKTNLNQSAQECYVSPFSQQQIDTYLTHYSQDVKNQRQGWNLMRYQTTLTNMPSLQGIMTSPLLLRMVVEVLPELANQQKRVTSDNNNSQQSNLNIITRADVYRLFIQRWFTREDVRLLELGNRPKDFDAQSSFGEFAEHLAFAMFLKGIVEVDFKEASQERKNAPEWDEYFNSADPTITKKRAGCPLKQVDNRYSFYHKSFLEYFAAIYIYKTLAAESTSQAKLFKLSDSPINQKFMTQDTTGTGQAMFNFLVDLISDQEIIRYLWSIVEESKNKAVVAQAASNAATLLNYARIPFSGKNLAKVRIPYFDGSYLIADHTNFQDADLTGANFTQAWLKEANFTGSELGEILFNELPSLFHPDEILNIAYVDGGRFLAAASADKVSLWECNTKRLVDTVEREKKNVLNVAYNPCKLQIAMNVFNPKGSIIQLWDIETKEIKVLYQFNRLFVSNIAFSKDGEWLAIAGYEEIKLLNLLTQEIRVLEGHTDDVLSIAFSPNGKQVVSGSADKTVSLWDIATGEARVFEGHTDVVKCVDFSNNGKLLLSGSNDHTVRVWDIVAGEVACFEKHKDSINIVTFSPDDQYIASASSDKTVFLWDLATKESRIFEGYKQDVSALIFSMDSKQLITACGASIQFWDVGQTKVFSSLNIYVPIHKGVVFNSDGQLLAVSPKNGEIQIRNSKAAQVSILKSHIQETTALAFSFDSQRLAIGYNDGIVQVWDITAKTSCVLEGLGEELDISRVSKLAFSPDNKYLASAFTGSSLMSGRNNWIIQLWDLATAKKEILTSRESPSSPTYLLISSNNRYLALATYYMDYGIIEVWDLVARHKIHELRGHWSFINSLAFNPDNQLLASGSDDKSIRLWDLASGEAKILEGQTGRILSLAFSPDGKQLVSGGDETTIRFWDVESKLCTLLLGGYSAGVEKIIWNSQELITASREPCIRVWHPIKNTDQTDTWQLAWSTNVNLYVEGCQFNQAKNLSALNIQLLKQKGAIGEPKIADEIHDSQQEKNIHSDKNLLHINTMSAQSFIANIGQLTNKNSNKELQTTQETLPKIDSSKKLFL